MSPENPPTEIPGTCATEGSRHVGQHLRWNSCVNWVPTSETLADIKDYDAKPAKPSDKEIGRLRRRYFTREFGTVNRCGHKFHPTDEPHTGCEACWEAYFVEQTGIRHGVEAIVRSFGIPQLKKTRGDRFTKMYLRFIAAHPLQIRGDQVDA
jgi:hypothetical protein